MGTTVIVIHLLDKIAFSFQAPTIQKMVMVDGIQNVGTKSHRCLALVVCTGNHTLQPQRKALLM